MYNREYWKDHVVDKDNNVIQQGTLQDQAHFNNIEQGIDGVTAASAIILNKLLHDEMDTGAEVHTLDLKMTGNPWPFNNTDTTVALGMLRENSEYGVDISVVSYSGGRLGNITAIGRARNGFKLTHDGSADNVRVTVRVTGGMSASR